MPPLDPPKPEMANRKHCVKINEPLSISVEKYVEFLRTDSIYCVVAQARDFVTKRDCLNFW